MVKLTALVTVYNERSRIGGFMTHARQWAQEIVVIDKSSTDGTPQMAADQGARVVTVPYTPAGHDHMSEAAKHFQTDWIWGWTCGEVPTRKLVETVRDQIEKLPEDVAIIHVPKKLYSFGTHDTRSPWSISYQPFVFHRARVTYRDCIHGQMAGKGLAIPFSEDCHVLHPTHPNAEAFFSSHMDYIRKEAIDAADPERRIREAWDMISRCDFGRPGLDDELLGQLCAWRFYHYGVMLACWEKRRGRTADGLYADLREEMLETEWGSAGTA